MLEIASGLFFLLCVTLAACVVCIILWPIVVLESLKIDRFNEYVANYTAKVSSLLFGFAGDLVTHWCGTKVYIYTDDDRILSDADQHLLIASNHRTRVDWMYVFWVYGQVISSNMNTHVILKESLKKVPIFGWAMKAFKFIFLNRQSREADLNSIQNTLLHLKNISKRVVLVIFPEGTDLSPSNQEKCREYCKQKCIPARQFVLVPKVQGTITAICALSQSVAGVGVVNATDKAVSSANSKPVVYHDVTIAYEDYVTGSRTSDWDIIVGKFPKAVHIFVKRYEIAPKIRGIQNDDKVICVSDMDALEKMIVESYIEKEKWLSICYQALCPGEPQTLQVEPSDGAMGGGNGNGKMSVCTFKPVLVYASHPNAPSRLSFLCTSKLTPLKCPVSCLPSCLMISLILLCSTLGYYSLPVRLLYIGMLTYYACQ